MRYLETNGIYIDEKTEDFSQVHVDFSEAGMNRAGIMHGGLVFSLADAASGLCVLATGNKCVTLNSTINYIKPVKEGRLIAKGRPIHKGRTTWIIRVDLENEAEVLMASATFTMFVFKDE